MTPSELLWFSVKAELKERPILVVPVLFFLSIILSAFILRAAEMPADEEAGYRFGWNYMWNSMWCTFITIVTGMIPIVLNLFLVGYGDIYPVSTMGKAVCVVMMFWGNFLISLIIVSLAGLVEFDR